MCQDICDSAWWVMGRLCGVSCIWWAWFSSVLHMGDWCLCGARTGFCWNYGILWRPVCVVIGFPCAMRGVYAHGNPTMTATDNAVPHDSAVPAGVGRARVCNIHHPGTHRRRQHHFTAVQPGLYDLQPQKPPHRESPHPKRSPCLRCTDTPQSRCGTGPISTRNSTDLGAGVRRPT